MVNDLSMAIDWTSNLLPHFGSSQREEKEVIQRIKVCQGIFRKYIQSILFDIIVL